MIIITIFVSFCNLQTFAATNCPTPGTVVNVNGTPYTCGYNNVADKDANGNNSLCYLQANNLLVGLLAILTGGINGCQALVGAPINGGLIFLLIAGVILGAYVIYKNKLTVEP